MLGSSSVFELKEPEGAVLFDLSQFGGGDESVLRRIAKGNPGIYAWFRTHRFSGSPAEIVTQIVNEAQSPKFLAREGAVEPYFNVKVSSRGNFSPSKTAALEAAMEDKQFRDGLLQAFKWSIFFQTPLYIGKAGCLQTRIRSHLKPDSILRSRLRDAGIDLSNTLLLIIPTNDSPVETEVATHTFVEDDSPEVDGEEGGSQETEKELLYEEIFSRVFSPAYSKRLG